jgi:hypothetical protein
VSTAVLQGSINGPVTFPLQFHTIMVVAGTVVCEGGGVHTFLTIERSRLHKQQWKRC